MISVPIERISGFSTPITDTQQLYADFHRQRIESDPELMKLKTDLEEGGEIPVELLNNQNTAYTGPLFFGTPISGSSSSKFEYSLGSGWLTVTSTDCGDCKTKYYN